MLLCSLQGMCQAAGYIYKKLVNDGILNQAFSIAPVRRTFQFGNYISAPECIITFPSANRIWREWDFILRENSIDFYTALHIHSMYCNPTSVSFLLVGVQAGHHRSQSGCWHSVSAGYPLAQFLPHPAVLLILSTRGPAEVRETIQ